MKTMTKEIKFRGLRTDGKGWAIGVPFYVKEERKCFIIDNCQSGTLSQHDTSFQGKEVHYKSVGQCIGLYDKNNIDMYEGDMVSDHIGFGYIEYFHSGVRVNYKNGLCKWLYDYTQKEFETIEVIGNIHEKGGSR